MAYVNIMCSLGNGCRGTVGDFLVCGGVGNDIKWILHPRNLHSDFHFQSHLCSIKSLGETESLLNYGMAWLELK